MIRPPGFRGAVFSSVSDGDLRRNLANRAQFARRLGIEDRWATVQQVHGDAVIEAVDGGALGPADGLFTRQPHLPVAVFVADCVPVLFESDKGVGAAHAGWRGLAQGVVGAVRHAMEEAGISPVRAVIGPSIGPCCYEVGPEVLDLFQPFRRSTTWGTPSVDLWAAAAEQLEGIPVTRATECTMHSGSFSHRREGTRSRLAAVTWRP